MHIPTRILVRDLCKYNIDNLAYGEKDYPKFIIHELRHFDRSDLRRLHVEISSSVLITMLIIFVSMLIGGGLLPLFILMAKSLVEEILLMNIIIPHMLVLSILSVALILLNRLYKKSLIYLVQLSMLREISQRMGNTRKILLRDEFKKKLTSSIYAAAKEWETIYD